MKPNPKRLHRQRAQMDAKLVKMSPAFAAMATPRGGWLKAIRESLGMPAERLGKRLGISKQAVLKLEANEVRRTLTLDSMDRVARALGCQLAYAIVPEKESLEALLNERARLVAQNKLKRVAHSMSLEAQEPPPDLQELQVRELSKELKDKLSHDLWDDL